MQSESLPFHAKPVRVAIYARYSSDQQRDASIEDQIRACRARIERDGWTLAETYTDHAISGASAMRPGYRQLLQDAEAGLFDVVLTEGLDRLSRDQEDTANLYKRMTFQGVRIVTLSEGIVDELHVGLRGTMNALYLKDLAQKTRRGLEGRVRQGKSGGGICYGYRVCREIGPDGLPRTGEREIAPDEARIVQRIFAEYADGASPRAIAARLNREGILGPTGGTWSMSTIYGNWRRGTGILNNELYAGRLVWNRQRFIKDPVSGRRQARLNPVADWIREEVPELTIVDKALWERVKARQASLRTTSATTDAFRPERARRARHLFSGLIICGMCGGGYILVGARHYGCANTRNRGTCTNRLTIRRDRLEEAVLDGLKEHLLDPELVRIFTQEYVREYNRLAAEHAASRDHGKRELARIDREIRQLVDAIKQGLRSRSLAEELEGLEARRDDLERRMAQEPEPPPRLHPRLAEIYRENVAALTEALNEDAVRTEAVEILRSLVEEIRLVPEGDCLAIELVGALAGILALTAERPPVGAGGRQTTLVAGARNHRASLIAVAI